MEKEIDGGEFIKKEEKPEGENKFITGDPSMITTDEVFALLGEQMVKAKNWAKIALAWNRNFNTLKQSISQTESQATSISKQNQDLKESNSRYIITNQALDKRITELNLCEKAYKELEIKYKTLEKTNNDSNIDIKNLLGDIEKLKVFIKESDKENNSLKEQILTRKKRAKKPKI